MNKIDAISNIIKENWSNEEIVGVWNDYCDNHCCCDDMIFYMGSFNELYDGVKPIEIVERVIYGDFRTDDDFFAFNGYGNIVSFNDVDDYGSFDMRYVAEHLVDCGDSDFTEVDNEALIEYFLNEYFPHYTYDDKMMEVITNIIEVEGFDFLMDDWNDIVETIETTISEL